MPRSAVATEDEVLFFIEQHELMGEGTGYVDVHLLAAAALDGSSRLWTRDKRLQLVAASLSLDFAID